MSDHEIGTIALRDVEHLCADLDPRRRHGESPQLEFFLFLQIFDNGDRLTAGRVVIKDVGDLLAFETAAQLVLDELDRAGTLRPIGCRDREKIGEALSVSRSGNSETR